MKSSEQEASLYSGEKDVEVFRIAQQNTIFNLYAKRHLDTIFAKVPNPVILDVGCSDGININLRLQGRNYHSLLGIDIDPEKIRSATADNPRQSFEVMDVCAPGFPEQLSSWLDARGLEGFDLIHISSVLMHVPDQEAVLSALRPFLTEQGILFIQDEDDGCNLVYPSDPFFDAAFALWDQSLESGDRHNGRRLPTLLRQAGYSDVRLLSSTISSLDVPRECLEAYWDLYFNSDLWSADAPEFFSNPAAIDQLSEYRRLQPQYRQAFLEGRFFVLMGVFFLTATR